MAPALFGEAGLASGLPPDKTVVAMNSLSLVDTQQLAERINVLSCQYLEVHGERMIKRPFNPGFRTALHR